MLAALGTDCWARAGSWWWSTSVRTSARHLEQAREK